MTKHVLSLLSGPCVFLLVYFLPIGGLPRSGHIVLATFLWAITWWMTQPVPWGITALLPMVLFPALGVMNVTATTALYGQTIFIWVLGLSLFGYAMEKHGLAKRFAIGMLNLPGVSGTTNRLLFIYMVTTGIVSLFVSTAAVVAMMMPIGLSLLSYVRTISGQSGARGRSNFATFIALGTLYGSVSGGVATIIGHAPGVVAVSLLERLTGETMGFFRWMKLGVPLAIVLLVTYYFILRFFFPPELKEIAGGREFLRQEAAKLGKMSRGEKNVVAAFVVMVVLFIIPSIAPFVVDAQDPLIPWLRQALSIWTVPPVVLLMLFALPHDTRKAEFESTLTWKDVVDRAPWNAIMLCTGAVAMTEALSEFGFVEFMQSAIPGIGLTPTSLPFVAAFSCATITEIASGVATTGLLGNIFIPAAAEIGFNPASIAMLLSNVAIGVAFPWSGAPTAMAFSSGEISMKDMMKAGLLADAVLALTAAVTHLLFGQYL
ncbi:MAG: SLC13 family permease [Terriglobia bacterium]